MSIIVEVLKFFGAAGLTLAVLGGLVALAYQAFKHFGAKWLDARFDARLQALRHQYDQELEQLRFKISAMLDRTVKLHQREFEVLPETWAKLADALSAVQSFVSPMQSYPDINKMSERQFESFIKACRLTDWQKEELRESPDKNALYSKQIFWHDRNEAKGKAIEYNRCFLLNGIFIKPDIKASFK